MKTTKSRHTRLYIAEEDEPLLDAICAKTGLPQTMVMTILVSAGLRAVAANSNRFELPLQLRVGAPAEPPHNRNLTPLKK